MTGGLRDMSKRTVGSRDLELDLLRGIAILLAMGWHIMPYSGFLPLDIVTWPGRRFGWAGVDLFFVLSGFLVGRLLFREIRATGSLDRRRFMVRRMLKLWPVFYTFLVLQLLLGDNPWQTFFFQNALHVQNYTQNSQAHLWSLAVEEHFYLIAVVLIPLAMARTWTFAPLRNALLVVMIACVVLRIVGATAGASWTALQIQTQYRIDALAAGVLLALISIERPEAFARALRHRSWWAVGAGFAALWLTIVDKGTVLGSTIGYSISYLGGACLLLAVFELPYLRRAPIWARPVAALGIYSYAAYIWHIAAARLFERGLLETGVDVPEAIVVVGDVAAAVTVAVVVTVSLEWPMLRIRNRLFPSRAVAG